MIIQSSSFLLNPLVSVVIPSYNRANIVSQTINSILNQNCNFDFEIIIGDDCSTDNAREVLIEYQKKYPAKIKLIFHEQNIGLGANWATCVKHCRGKYIANCDNDDYWHNENKLQIQVDFMESNPNIGVCHTFYRNASKNKIVEKQINNSRITEPLYIAIAKIHNFECCNSSILYRKESLDKYVLLDDYIQYKFVLQDWNTWVTLAYYNVQFHCIPVSTTTITIDNHSITRNTDFNKLEKRIRRQASTTKYISDRFPAAIQYSEQEYETYIDMVLLNLCFINYDYKMAHKISIKLFTQGINNKKVRFSRNVLFFYSFSVIKNIIRSLNI